LPPGRTRLRRPRCCRWATLAGGGRRGRRSGAGGSSSSGSSSSSRSSGSSATSSIRVRRWRTEDSEGVCTLWREVRVLCVQPYVPLEARPLPPHIAQKATLHNQALLAEGYTSFGTREGDGTAQATALGGAAIAKMQRAQRRVQEAAGPCPGCLEAGCVGSSTAACVVAVSSGGPTPTPAPTPTPSCVAAAEGRGGCPAAGVTARGGGQVRASPCALVTLAETRTRAAVLMLHSLSAQ